MEQKSKMRAARLLVRRELRPRILGGLPTGPSGLPAGPPSASAFVLPPCSGLTARRPRQCRPLSGSRCPHFSPHTHTCPPSQHTHERGWPPPSSSDPSPRPEWGQVGREFAQKLLSGWSGCTGARGGAGGEGARARRASVPTDGLSVSRRLPLRVHSDTLESSVRLWKTKLGARGPPLPVLTSDTDTARSHSLGTSRW